MIIYPGNPLSVDTSTSPLLIYEVRDNNPLDLIQEFNNKKQKPTCHEKHQQGASDDLDAQIKLKKKHQQLRLTASSKNHHSHHCSIHDLSAG